MVIDSNNKKGVVFYMSLFFKFRFSSSSTHFI